MFKKVDISVKQSFELCPIYCNLLNDIMILQPKNYYHHKYLEDWFNSGKNGCSICKKIECAEFEFQIQKLKKRKNIFLYF
jgi:hypothetical protein